MDTESFHLEQYKMLREEIMQNMREVYLTERWGAVAVGAIYAWFLSHKPNITSGAIWFITPIVVILLCAVRCLDLTVRTNNIAEYLRRIEEVSLGQDSKVPGWERYKQSNRDPRRIDVVSTAASAIGWTLAIAGSIVVSWLLSR